jgi:cation:H+ antiporter
LVLYLKFFKNSKIYKEDHVEEEEIDEVSDSSSLSVGSTLLFLFIGALGLYFGSEFLIEGSVNLASAYGVSERVIGITVISVGTSIPELAASIIAAIKKERAISLGNLIGSNIFNILAVLGVTSMITPIRVSDDRLLTNDLFWMLGFAVVLLPLIYMFTRRELKWKEGLFLLVGYIVFILNTIQ